MYMNKQNLQDIISLTPLQEGMLYHYLSEPESEQYFEQFSLVLSGEISVEAMKRAWQFVSDTNEMLRTVFRWDKLEKPVQIILKEYTIPVVEYDFSGAPDIEKLIRELKEGDRKRKIDIASEPLRIMLCKLEENKYEMIISNHHIIYDGWSNGVILKELFEAYNCICNGRVLEKIEKNKFKEFVKWHLMQDKGKQENYWREYLKNFEKQTAVPIDSKNRVYGSKPETYKYTFTEELANRIYEFTKEKQITLASLFYSTWGILLQRYNNTDDVIFGTTVSGRSAKINGIEEMAGLFINTIPLRINPEQSCSAAELINSIGRDLEDREEFEGTPLVDINSYSEISGNGSLFDSIVVIENYPLEKRLLDTGNKLKVEAYEMFEMTNYDMTLGVKLFDSIELDFCCKEGTFEAESVKRLCGHFVNILKGIMENADARVCELDMLGEDEKHQLLHGFNNTESEYESDKTIFELFEEQAERIPEQAAAKIAGKKNTALTASEEITYGELDKKSNRLAAALRAKGVKPNSIIGIMAERSIEMLVGIMGILKSGGAYLPIDPEYPEDRIKYMLEDSGAFMLLAQGLLKDGVSFDGAVLDLMAEDIYRGEGHRLEKVNSPDDLAYVIYTSGTTGKPKGVMVEHRSISNAIQWRRKKYGLDTSDNVLQLFSFIFDGFLTSFFTPVVSGSKVVLLRDEEAKDPVCIKNKIRDGRITHFIAVPGLYSAILEASGRGELESLKKVALAGDKVAEGLLERSREKNDRLEIINEYGPTEGSVVATASENIASGGRITIGKPIDNVQVYILDRNNNVQPIGIYGELCIAGGGLARGYLNRQDLTSEKFVQNPFAKGMRLYKTGDLARWLPDGNIELMGRADNQVKIRGFRIEPGEVENRLLSHEYIKEAVVVAKEDSEGSKQLCAYITGEKELAVNELREFLGRSLADYMIPSYFIQMEKLPLTQSGKIDRAGLPEPDGNIATDREYEAPRDEVEDKLAAIWQEVLKVRRVGINDSFFELGGHSLKATGMVAKIHKELNIEVPVKEVFRIPTIKGLSEYIKGQKPGIYETIQLVEEREYYPVSPAQKRIYTLQKLDPDSTSYNMSGVFIIEGDLERDKLESAFKALVSRHESFRTSFELMGNELVQRVYKNAELEIEYCEQKEEEAQERIKSFLRPFDLSKAPLIRAVVIRLMDESENKRHLLLLDIHHIIADGTSIGILTREFGELYKGRRLAELRLQYKDFAAWQSDILSSEEVKRQGEYWINEYSKGASAGEIPVLNLPTDYPRPGIQSFEGSSIKFSLNKELTGKLGRIAKETGATMYMVLLAGFNILLSKYSGQEDIIVGSPIAARHHADLENVIGMFVNTLAMRNYPVGSKTIIKFIEEVKTNSLRAYENQDYQFEELVEKLDIKRDLSRNPLFDVMFAMQNMDMGKIELEGISIKPYGMENGVSKFDITLTAEEAEEKIGLSIEYCSRLFNKGTIERMAGHLKNVLNEITYNANKRISEIEMLGEEERHKLLYGFNDTYAEYPRDKAVYELFEEQVNRTPDNIALAYEDRQLTYRELNGRANQLARVLRQKGVVPDSIVGIMVERSIEMIVGIMGILKAGGVYLPIDPEYPKDRIEYMLEDSNADILITREMYIGNIADVTSNIIDVEDISVISGMSGENINAKYDTSRKMYLIYTSGSTGNPKGAAARADSFMNLTNWFTREFNISESDNILLIAPVGFDLAQKNLYAALVKGGRLCILPERTYNYTNVLKIIHEERITIINCTPSAFQLIIDAATDYHELGGLRWVFLGGEPINTAKLVKWIKSQYYRAEIVNTYGPTECTDIATYYRISKQEIENMAVIPIGRPIDNVKLYIVDKYNNLLPTGHQGELCIGGVSLGAGYLNRTELTAEKFVENPFEPGKVMYKTGDLTRWLPDGNIEFLGRIDDQVKIRGFRIELGEIESRLLKHEAVGEAVVAAKEDQGGNKYLCAYITAGKALTVSELGGYLRQELPDYMVPSYFVQLDKMPLTPNGKIDRKALPEPDGSIETGTEYEAPRNTIEEKLVTIWQEVLGAEKIGIGDNFFDLGGHSLKATSMVSKIHKELNIEVPLREIFKTPTIKGLSEYMKGHGENIYSAIEPVEEKERYVSSSAQKRLYTLQQFDMESTGYNIPGTLEIEGKLDIERLEAVFGKLIERHESLRSSFELIEEDVVQKIHKEAELEIEYKEAREDVEEILRSFIRPFDLSKAPLLRVGLIRLHPEKHILMYDMHHIISDGTSMGILVKEFAGLYEGKALPELRLQYKDYAAWQNGMISSEVMRKQEEHWLKTFKGEIPVLSLPTDYQRPAIQSFEGDSIHFELDREITKGLRKIVKKTGATMYMVLLSGLNILLSKYSGQEDIAVGSPIAGRPHADLENIIGMFVNTLTMRNYPESSKTVIEFIEEVKTNSLKAYENQDYQFEELVEKIGVKRDLSRNPLFDVMLAVQNMEIGEIGLNGISIKPYEMKNRTAKFDITVYAVEAVDNIEMDIEYCTKLYKKETIERMMGHYINILEKVSQNPDITLELIEMLSEEEKHKLLYEFNNTYTEYPKDKAVYELFEEQAAKTPDNAALVYEDKVLTYRELNRKSNQLARVLRDKGVKEGSIVGIMVERSLEMIIGILGILKAGGAYLPIDPEYPEERIEYMLEDSRVNILLTRDKLKQNKNIENIFCINSLLESTAVPHENIGIRYNTDRPIYVIYTSGSTGNPKGSVIKSSSFTNLINWFTGKFNIGADDSVLLIAPVSFDLAQKNLYAALVKGGRLCILPDKVYNYQRVLEFIEKEQITLINCTPSAFQLITDAGEGSEFSRLKRLRHVFLGGEPINIPKLLPWVKSNNYNAQIVNTYGPTECTDISTSYVIPNNQMDKLTSVPIGKPIDNIKLYIVKKSNELAILGQPGEICVGGISLGYGYLNRPELTEEKFAANPFEPGERMYRTGDMGRWLPDGNIEFLGRIDHQVKIRGFRIELGEIESRLIKYEAVEEAVVIAREEQNGSKYLCAYLVGNRQFTVSELREYLKKELPDYMVPSYFIQLERMPLTPNGKIDRKALPEPDRSIGTGAEYEAPRNETEEKLVKIWKEILGVGKIGICDNFFELGGHSLKAINLIAKTHKELNIEIPLREIFKMPTIKGIAEYIKGMEENIYASIAAIEEREHYPASSAQKRIYTLQQFEMDNTSYNMPSVMAIEGELNRNRLEGAFKKLIKRHESLRTSFEIVNEEIVQKIYKEVNFSISCIEEKEDKADEIVKGYIKSFDLSKAPLLRVGLIKLAEDKHILMADMHHIISDGVSMGILTKEFAELYEGKELPELRIQYKDYAAWQNEMISSEVMKKQEEHWLNTFHGEVPVLDLPTDYPRPSLQSFEGDRITYSINKEITEGIRKIAKEAGATIYMVLLSGFNILLSKYSGQEDIIVGSPIAGRHHSDLENIIGMFVNTLAMRNYPEGSKTVIEFIEEVKTNALKAYENQDYQFEELVEKIGVKRDLSRNPLFDVMLAMQNTEMGEIGLNGVSIKPYDMKNRIAKFDITVSAVETEDSIEMDIEYCTKLYKKETIERMMGHFINILGKVSQNPDIILEQIEMISEEEKHKLLYEFNNTYAEYPKDKTIHELFEEQAAKTPDNIAAVYEDKVLTYRELNRKANQLARVLRDNGAGADSIVGIMVERSLEMIVGILGILKAGGAYLPIDPEYPEERKQYILEDSKANLLIIQKHFRDKVQYKGTVIEIEDSMNQRDASNLEIQNKPEDMAYIIYTSGTTGKPKGAMIEHRNVVRLMKNDKLQFEFSETDVWTMFHSYCFDFSVWEMYGALLYGGKLVIVPKLTAKDTGEYLKLLKKEEVTVLNQTPTAFYNLISEEMKEEGKELKLRYVIFGGEALKPLMLKEWKRKYPEAALINMYGITETTVHVTYKEIGETEIAENRSNIGRPIPTLTTYIMDKNRKLAPVGVPGELCVGGEGVCRGYLNRPELTAEKFVQNPYRPDEIIYRSGDLAKLLSDGEMEYLGRIDNQVKIRGHRVELGEIENQLLKHEGIKEAVVITREEQNGSRYLCAYIVGNRQFTVAELREHLGKELPEYMIPLYFIQLPKMPLTANGKIDRKILPEPDGNVNTGTEYEMPRDAIEEKLVKIWEEVLGIKNIGINDNFFDLGGHSLKATTLVSKMHKEFNIRMDLLNFFKYPTIKGLSELIRKSKTDLYTEIKRLPWQNYYELSYAQKRLWIISQLQAESSAYNMPGRITLHEKVNEGVINKVFEAFINRHEAFRTRFDTVEGEPMQIIEPQVSFNINTIDLCQYSEKDRTQKLEQIFEDESAKVFDLKVCPLLRAVLVKLAEDKYEFLFSMHHIISDGWSIEILKNEFYIIYSACKCNQIPSLEPLEIQYKDFAAWQNRLLKDETGITDAKEFWKIQLDGELPVLNLPVSYSYGQLSDRRSAGYRIVIPELVADRLKALARQHNTSLYIVLVSSFNLLLSKITGQQDIIIGAAGSGRNHESIKNIIGYFINTTLLRNQIDDEEIFSDFLIRVNENTLKALEYQSYPLELVLDELKINYPAISVFFNMLNMGESSRESLSEIESYPIEKVQEVKFDLAFYLKEYANGIEIICDYLTGLFEPTRIKFILEQYGMLLKGIAYNPDKKVTEYKVTGQSGAKKKRRL